MYDILGRLLSFLLFVYKIKIWKKERIFITIHFHEATCQFAWQGPLPLPQKLGVEKLKESR